jgi:hypothetical protein
MDRWMGGWKEEEQTVISLFPFMVPVLEEG